MTQKNELTQTCAEDKRTTGEETEKVDAGKCRLYGAWEICNLYVLPDLFVIAPLGVAVAWCGLLWLAGCLNTVEHNHVSMYLIVLMIYYDVIILVPAIPKSMIVTVVSYLS